MTKPSGVVSWDDPDANMYGCQPCPKCKSKFRAVYKRGAAFRIDCDDCGATELAVNAVEGTNGGIELTDGDEP